MWTGLPKNSLRSLIAILRNEPGSVAGVLKSPSAITIGKGFLHKKMGAQRQIPKSGGFVPYPGEELVRSSPATGLYPHHSLMIYIKC